MEASPGRVLPLGIPPSTEMAPQPPPAAGRKTSVLQVRKLLEAGLVSVLLGGTTDPLPGPAWESHFSRC